MNGFKIKTQRSAITGQKMFTVYWCGHAILSCTTKEEAQRYIKAVLYWSGLELGEGFAE